MAEQSAPPLEEAPQLEPVWDAPTRLLKWSLAGAVAAAWGYGQSLTFATMSTHMQIGYAVAALLAARWLWGFAGAPASRFSTLFADIARAPRYLRGVMRPEPSYWPGHNPLGSLWLVALWLALTVQIGSGFLSYSDSFFQGGPLHELVSAETQATANAVHALGAKVLLGLVLLHLTAVFFYAIWKMEDLIGPMMSGAKWVRRRD